MTLSNQQLHHNNPSQPLHPAPPESAKHHPQQQPRPLHPLSPSPSTPLLYPLPQASTSDRCFPLPTHSSLQEWDIHQCTNTHLLNMHNLPHRTHRVNPPNSPLTGTRTTIRQRPAVASSARASALSRTGKPSGHLESEETSTSQSPRLMSVYVTHLSTRRVKALESRSQLLDAALASADEANRRWEECRALVDQLRIENAALRAALSGQTQLGGSLAPGQILAGQLPQQPQQAQETRPEGEKLETPAPKE